MSLVTKSKMGFTTNKQNYFLIFKLYNYENEIICFCNHVTVGI